MSTGYQEIYGEIGGQRKQISDQRSELAKPVVQGTAKQRRIAMRRVKRTPEYGQNVRAKREYSSELDVAERELAEHESKVREYEREGYKVSKKDDKYRFTKTVKKKQQRSGYSYLMDVVWRDSGGAKHTVVTKGNTYSWLTQQIAKKGGSVVKVTVRKGKPGTGKTVYETKTETETLSQPTTTTTFNLPPLVNPNKKIADAVSHAAGVTLKNYYGQSPPRWSRPGTTATMEEVGTSYITTPTLSKDPEPTQVEVATKRAELTITRDQVYDISKIENIYQSELSKRGYSGAIIEDELKIYKGDFSKAEIISLEKENASFSDLVARRYGSERPDIYVAKHLQDWGIPTIIAGVQTATGLDRNAWSNLHEQYSADILQGMQQKNESFGDYTKRFWSSEQAIYNVYIPLATVGMGYGSSFVKTGLKSIPISSRVTMLSSKIGSMSSTAGKVITKFTPVVKFTYKGASSISRYLSFYGARYGPKISKASKVFMVGYGGAVGVQAVLNPSQAALIVGRASANIGKMYGGFLVGGRLYRSTHAKQFYDMYQYGNDFTPYEQKTISFYHQRAVMRSQYKPYEFGTPSTRYVGEIRPIRTSSVIKSFRISPSTGSPIEFEMQVDTKNPKQFSFYEFYNIPVESSIKTKIPGELNANIYTKKQGTVTFFTGRRVGKGGIGLGSSSDIVPRWHGFSYADKPIEISKPFSSDIYFKSNAYTYTIMPSRVIRSSGGVISTTRMLNPSVLETKGVMNYFKQPSDWNRTLTKSIMRQGSHVTYGFSSTVHRTPAEKIDIGSFDIPSDPSTITKTDVPLPGGLSSQKRFNIDIPSPFGPRQTYFNRIMAIDDIGYTTMRFPPSSMPSSLSIQIPLSGAVTNTSSSSIQSSISKTISRQALSLSSIQNSINQSLRRQIPVSLSLTSSSLSSIQNSISQSLTRQVQTQSQITQTVTILSPITIATIPNLPLPPHPPPPPNPPPPSYENPPPPDKIYWFDDSTSSSIKRKKRKKKSLKGYKTGYRYREWKVPKLKDLIPVR